MIRLALESCLPIFRKVVARQDHDGNIRINHFDLFGKLKPIFSRQPDVHKDDVRTKDIHSAKKPASIRFFFNLHHRKAGMQNLLEYCPKSGIVFHN